MRIVSPEYQLVGGFGVDRADAILQSIERAGRTCYQSSEKITESSADAFVRMLISRGHDSVLEHESLTIRFRVDRGVSHELVRHRIAAFSQESTRYCAYGAGRFGSEVSLCPLQMGLTLYQIERRKELWGAIERVYLAELREGVAPQQARDNLPTCTKTEIVMTANLREWRHVLRLRTSREAHPQMRLVMVPLLVDLRGWLNPVFGDLPDVQLA